MVALECGWWPSQWGDCVSKWLGQALEEVTGGLFGLIFDAIKALVIIAVEAVLKAVGTLWIDIDTPDFTNNGAVMFVHRYTFWALIFAATISVIIGGIRMAVSQRGEPLRDIIKSLLTMVVVSTAGLAVAAALIQIADVFSEWIVDEAMSVDADRTTNDSGDFPTVLTNQLMNPLKTEGVGLMLVIVIGILMVITSIIQLVLMVIRYGMLILLVGVLPLTAAATNTEAGMMWFKRAVAWLAGFILYKPVAAIIYAAAIQQIGAPADKGDATLKMMIGVTMMALAVVALPAILRFVSPKTGG